MKYVALIVVGLTTGFLIARFLVPFVINLGSLVFVVLPTLLVATLLIVRASRRTGSGS